MSNDFSILFGDGNGFFEIPVFFPTGGNPWDFEFKDITSDGNIDIVVAVNGEASKIMVYKGDGLGEFTLLNSFVTSAAPLGLALADFNGDSKLDLAASINEIDEENIVIYQGNGMGFFSEVMRLSSPGFPGQLFADDLNFDGKSDLIVNDERISVFLNQAIISSTPEVSNEVAVQVFPNPVVGQNVTVTIENAPSSLATLRVINNLGQILLQESFSDISSHTFSTNHLSSGLYYVQVEYEDWFLSEKLLVSNQ